MKIKAILLYVTLLASSVTCFAQNDWAGFKVYDEANTKVTTRPDAVFMGNSITQGWQGAHPEFFTDNNYVGRGISGQVTSQMLVRFRSDVINLKPKAVVILAGTNDIAQNNGIITVEHIFENFVSMAELAKANKIKVVLCSVLPAHHYPWRQDIESIKPINELNSMLKEYAKKNKIAYADYYSAMVDERQGLDKKYQNDEVHPNKAGYAVMEEVIQKILKKVVR